MVNDTGTIRITIGDRLVAFQNSTVIWLDGKTLPYHDWDITSCVGHLHGFRYWLESE